MSYLWYT